METLAEPRIDQLGTTRIEADTSPEQLREGRASMLRFVPEQGTPTVFVGVQSQEEGTALRALFDVIAAQQHPAAIEIRTQIEQTSGERIDWQSLSSRYSKATDAF